MTYRSLSVENAFSFTTMKVMSSPYSQNYLMSSPAGNGLVSVYTHLHTNTWKAPWPLGDLKWGLMKIAEGRSVWFPIIDPITTIASFCHVEPFPICHSTHGRFICVHMLSADFCHHPKCITECCHYCLLFIVVYCLLGSPFAPTKWLLVSLGSNSKNKITLYKAF